MPENSNQSKVSNYSFDFDGVDDYIQAPLDGTSTGGILAATDSDINLTISLWFKLNSSANLKGIFQWANQLNDGTPFILLQQRNSTDRIRFIVDGTYQSLEDVNIGQWYNVILTRTASDNTWRGYLDGVEFFDYDDGGSMSYAVRSSATDIYMANGYNGYADCNIDEFAVWNSVQNVSDIYNSGVPTTLPSGAVAHWKLGEQANFTDNWLVNNSALSNYSTRSFSFDGVDDYVDVFDSVTVPTAFQSIGNSNSYSISAWIKTTQNAAAHFYWYSGATIIELRQQQGANSHIPFNFGISYNPSGGYSFLTFGRSNNYATGAELVFSTADVNDGNWHHVAITIDNDDYIFYVDGSTAGSGTFSTATGDCSVSTTTSNMQIGSRSTDAGVKGANNLFNGQVDELSIFNYKLTSGNITSIYNSGVPNNLNDLTTAPILWYRMGEDATFATNWSLPDNGSGSNTGTSANMDLADLEGNAPNYTGGGLSANMTIEDRVGNAPNSNNNALSYNMDEADRETDVPS